MKPSSATKLLPRLLFYSGILSVALSSSVWGQSGFQRETDPIPPKVESLFSKGIKYLSSSQNEQGSWSERYGEQPGVVALCTLAFLASGEDPNAGPYSQNISRALNHILSEQSSSNGYIGSSMYNHGFATLALAESYGMVNDPRLATALKKAVDLILTAQKGNREKAWRYTPETDDADTTVTGCQIVALLAARNAGIAVPDKAILEGLAYLDKCRSANGGIGYTSAGGTKPTLTAIGVTCFSLAKKKEGKEFAASVQFLRGHLSHRDRNYPFYFEYYMSQALFHADPELWEDWNNRNIRYLSACQSSNGAWLDSKGSAYAKKRR